MNYPFVSITQCYHIYDLFFLRKIIYMILDGLDLMVTLCAGFNWLVGFISCALHL